MKKFKQKLFVSCMSLFIVLGISVPVFASSQYYSFTMRNSVVDGSRNNKYYSFNGGKVTISGSHTITERRYPNYTPQNVRFILYQERFGPDKPMGEIIAPAEGNVNGIIASSTEKGKKYYLYIYTVYNDFITRQGSGSLNN